jgi:hypothetical protein
MMIEDYLLGHWTNRYQAQSDPTNFASVEIVWKRVDDGFESMNYKRVNGPDDPYRRKRHKIRYISDTEAVIENYHLDWTRHPKCDILFTFDGQAWHGKLLGEGCRGYRGNRVVSEVHAYGDKLHTMDQGYDEDNNLVWGSTQLYRFVRM